MKGSSAALLVGTIKAEFATAKSHYAYSRQVNLASGNLLRGVDEPNVNLEMLNRLARYRRQPEDA